jgi:hypothetical protein
LGIQEGSQGRHTAKLDGIRGSVTASMPDIYRFTNIRLKVGIYKLSLRAFILIGFMGAGYFRQARCAYRRK